MKENFMYLWKDCMSVLEFYEMCVGGRFIQFFFSSFFHSNICRGVIKSHKNQVVMKVLSLILENIKPK